MSEQQSRTEPTFGDLVSRYAADPTDEHLASLRAAITAHPSFDPGLDVIGGLPGGIDEANAESVVSDITARMPGAFLSPSAHTALSEAHAHLDRGEDSRREALWARMSVGSVLRTGEGTRGAPWSVLRVADEYDVLRARGLVSSSQTLVEDEGRRLDRHELDDGSTAWFRVEG